MPVGRKLLTFLDEIVEFVLAVIHHWRGALTSSVVISVGLTAYQLYTGETLKLQPYLFVLAAIGLPVAVFLAWVEQYRGRETAQREVDQLRLAPAPDGVIYRENIEHRRRIAELEKQLHDAAPRDIPIDQRLQIAQRLSASMPTVEGGARPWPVNVVPLHNASDSHHFAKAIVDVLKISFDSLVGGRDGANLANAYSMDDIAGVVLMEPTASHASDIAEYHRQCAESIIKSFAPAVEITRGQSEFHLREITLLVGRRA